MLSELYKYCDMKGVRPKKGFTYSILSVASSFVDFSADKIEQPKSKLQKLMRERRSAMVLPRRQDTKTGTIKQIDFICRSV